MALLCQSASRNCTPNDREINTSENIVPARAGTKIATPVAAGPGSLEYVAMRFRSCAMAHRGFDAFVHIEALPSGRY